MRTHVSIAVGAGIAALTSGCDSLCIKDKSCSAGACMSQAPLASAAAKREGVVNTAALVAIARTKTAMTPLDARAGKYDDGNRLPGAKALAPDATEEQVRALLPDKQALVVTYCANLKCPASHMLGERLRQLGYTNVLEYHEGIEGWQTAGHPIEKAMR